VRGQLKEKGIELKTEAERLATDAKTQEQDLQEKGRIVLSDNVKKAQEAVQTAQDKLGKSAPSPAETTTA